MKTQVAVMYGGRSCEHEVSIITALQAMDALDTEQYDVIPVYFAHDGRVFTGDKLRDVDFYKNFDPAQVMQTLIVPQEYERGARLIRWPGRSGLFGGVKTIGILDVALLCFHGLNGEDGTIQGMLELYDLPYTSAGLGGSAMGMDKIAMKLAFEGMGLPVLPMVWFDRSGFEADPDAVLNEIEGKLTYPIYVKPANLGSSIGISRATDRESLRNAIEIAASYDRRILAEQGLEKPIEVNCSVLGFGGETKASVCEMPAQWEEFLSYEDKYMRGGKNAQSQGMAQLSRQIPAPIGDEMTARVQEMAQEVFRAFDLKGVVRIDFMIERESNKLYVGEVNTIPGSLAFYLWEPLGMPFPKLLDEMIERAFQAHREKEKQAFTYNSRILSQFGSKAGKLGGAKGGKFGGKL